MLKPYRVLSQLSYAPKLWNLFNFRNLLCASCQVGRARFADSLLSQLSYAPELWNLFNFRISFCASCQVGRARFADCLLSQLRYRPKRYFSPVSGDISAFP